MNGAIPRDRVARALGVDASDLPPGDLPTDRLADRFLGYLRATADGDSSDTHPEVWTYAVLAALVEEAPGLALDAVRSCLSKAETPEEVALVAAGPLEELIVARGAEVIDVIEDLAARSPRFAYALTGVWPPEGRSGLLWARIEAARRDAPALDEGAPLPGPEGLLE